MRNPTLMIALGFELKAPPNGERNPWARYRVPSDGAFSRFKQTLIEVDEATGCVQALFEAQRHKLTDCCRISVSGSVTMAKRSSLIPPAASWLTGWTRSARVSELRPGCDLGLPQTVRHRFEWQRGSDPKAMFGYELHLLGDVNYELPIGFTLAPAHEIRASAL